MTIDLQEARRIYQCGIELGRTMAKREMDEFAILTAGHGQVSSDIGNIYTNPPSAVSKLRTIQHKSIKPPVAATAAKKALGPRTKGVKEAILALLSSNPMSAGDIISSTGFKGTSVRATLMGIKKAGLAMNIDGHWVAVHHDGQGNSESEAHPS